MQWARFIKKKVGKKMERKQPIIQNRWKSKGAIAGIISLVGIIFTTAGIDLQSLTTWAALGDNIIMVISNPYLVGLIGIAIFAFYNDTKTKNKV